MERSNGGLIMTRADFEAELAARLEDIRALYKRYNPRAFEENRVYLSMFLLDSNIHANNRATYTDNEGHTDKDAPCYFYIDKEGKIHSTKI